MSNDWKLPVVLTGELNNGHVISYVVYVWHLRVCVRTKHSSTRCRIAFMHRTERYQYRSTNIPALNPFLPPQSIILHNVVHLIKQELSVITYSNLVQVLRENVKYVERVFYHEKKPYFTENRNQHNIFVLIFSITVLRMSLDVFLLKPP